jgi:uncharacterized protein YjbI with pentapeptide repeats
MTDKDSKSESGQRRFSQEQYDILLRCSQKNDMIEWNEWRKKNVSEKILLEDTDFAAFNLKGVDFSDYGGIASGGTVFLADASFVHTCLEHAKFTGADLRRADFTGADLISANFIGAHLEKAILQDVKINGQYVMYSFYFRGACFDEAYLQGADFRRAMVDSSTSFWKCLVDHETDFRDTALVTVQMEQEAKELLKYNERRMNWEKWYTQHSILKWPVRLFWLISDYGLSTVRIIIAFVVLAVVFASIYCLWGLISPPGIVDYLFVDGNGVEVGRGLALLRAIHFSVVIMTVGFTNMHANAHSLWAHILVGLQMILGFVLLGALVTRFAVLFTAGGPAGRFADEKEKKPQET